MRTILLAGIAIAAVLIASIVVIALNEQQAEAAAMSRRFIAQQTAMSATDQFPDCTLDAGLYRKDLDRTYC